MEYPDKPATLDTQETGLRQITIGHTRHRTETNNQWAHKTQDCDKQPLGTQDTGVRQIAIEHTRHRTETNNY